MRAARPAHRAEAPHERGEREDDDLAFGQLFEALRSSFVPSVGTTDAHAKKATMDDASPRAARARLDKWWTARREGDARERHERRLSSIRASIACVARRRDAFGDRVRASLARVCLEEDAACGVSAARAEAMAARAESFAGAWRAETLGNAAESVTGCMEEVSKARDALLAAHDERSLLALARGVVGASTKVAPAKDLAFAPVEALAREVLNDADAGPSACSSTRGEKPAFVEDDDEKQNQNQKTRFSFRVTSVVSLEHDADADDGVGVASPASTRAFLADYVEGTPKSESLPRSSRRGASLGRVEATFCARQKKTQSRAKSRASRWGVCLVPLTAARGAARDGEEVQVDPAALQSVLTAVRVGVRLSSPPQLATPFCVSPRRPRSTGCRATIPLSNVCGDVSSSDDSSDDSSDVGFPPGTRLASFAAASLAGATRDKRVFALYDFERDGSEEDANQVRAWDERFRRRRVATVAHLHRVLEERRASEKEKETTGRRARLVLCVLVEKKTRRDEDRFLSQADAAAFKRVRGDGHSLGAGDDRADAFPPTTAVTETETEARFVPVTERALAELARAYLSRRARRALGRGADAAPPRVRGSNRIDADARFSFSSSRAHMDAGGVCIALVYEETAAGARLCDASATVEGKTVKPAFLASIRSRDANEPDAPRTPSTPSTLDAFSSSSSLSCREVVSAIAEAASAAAAEHAGDGGRADRFPRFFDSETSDPNATVSDVENDAFFGRVGRTRVAPRDWSARDEELDAAAEALGDAEEDLEALRASRARARNALRERNE